MFRYSKLLVVLSLVCLAGSPRWGIAEETAKEEHQVFIEVCVAEISLSKLRTLGFDTSALHLDTESAGRTDDGQRDAISTIAALGKDNLVRVISHPRLATMSGRQASIQVGDAIKLEVVPQVGRRAERLAVLVRDPVVGEQLAETGLRHPGPARLRPEAHVDQPLDTRRLQLGDELSGQEPLVPDRPDRGQARTPPRSARRTGGGRRGRG